jgi:negative regulator of sigma E activity
MSKLRIAFVTASVLALGLMICPRSPRVDADRLLRNVLLAQHNLNYEATQKHVSMFYGKEIHSTIDISHESGSASEDRRLERLILRNYVPLIEGRDRIAGRDTWVLRLKPRVKHRPWKQLWVDKKTCAIMASRDWSAANSLKRSMRTISIRFDRSRGERSLSYTAVSPKSQSILSTLHAPTQHLPAGFGLTSFESSRSGQSSHWTYCDGLYSISVFMNQPGSPGGVIDEPLDWGQGLVYTARRRGWEIAVVADLQPDEIKRIAHSFTH